MATDTRIYAVFNRFNGTEENKPRLVRASNKFAAMRHVVSDTFTAKLASQDDLVKLMSTGVPVETAGEPDAESFL